MSTMIHCKKLDKEAEALAKPPYPGDLGKQIQAEISAEAWQQWLDRQTMFINEYRLNMLEKKDRDFLKEHMQKFLFENEDTKPEGFVSKKGCG